MISLFSIILFTTIAGRSVLEDPLPNPVAFKGWKQVLNETIPEQSVNIKCQDRSLIPTHPEMSLKKYHKNWLGSYNHFLLSAQDSACQVGGAYRNSKGIFPCFMGRQIRYFVLSDTFKDKCGNFYRGYFEILFFKDQESEATLYSPGRSVVKKEKRGAFPEYIPGAPIEVKEDSFFLFQEATASEIEEIRNILIP